jgi:plastocyanin
MAPPACEYSAPVTVVATDFSFNPSSFEVCPGQSITVRNDGTVTHNFSASSAGINQDVAPGSEISVGTPSDSVEPGTFPFSCSYHAGSGMTGQFTLSG